VRVILFGATGMVGQGVLRECLLDPDVTAVLSVVRSASAGSASATSDKVREIVADNFYDLSGMQREFEGYDACFFCLGVSSFGRKEPEYRHITVDITLSAAHAILQANPASSGSGITFVYISGAGTNANGRQMWARVKGETESALLALPFKSVYLFRPGVIVPLDGIKSKTAAYRISYTVLKPLLPLLLQAFPKAVTSTRQIGRAMLHVATQGYPKQVLEAKDIATL
jgi:uncharacterized protein YbjT (DUF2867 family)